MADGIQPVGLAVAEEAPAGAVAAPTLREVLEPLLSISQNERKFGCRALLKCLEQLENVEHQLLHRKAPEEEALADQDK